MLKSNRETLSRGLLQAAFVIAVLGLPLLYGSFASNPFVSPKLLVLGIASALTACGWALADSPLRRLSRPALLALAGALLLSALSYVLISRMSGESWWGRDGQYVGCLVMVYSFLMYVLGILLSSYHQSLRALLSVLVAAAIPILILTVWELTPLALPAGLGVGAAGHPTATFGSSLQMGAYLAAVSPLATVLAFTYRGRPRVRAGLTVLALASVVGVAVAGSWAVMLGLAASYLLVGLLVMDRRHLPKMVMGVIAFVGLLLALGTLLPANATLFRLVDLDNDLLSDRRLQIPLVAARSIVHHPLLGLGPANFLEAFLDALTPGLVDSYFTSGPIADAHNWLLELAASYGLPFLVLFIYLLGRPFRALRRLDAERRACLCAMVSLLVSHLFLPLALSTLPFLFLLAGLATAPYATTAGSMSRSATSRSERARSLLHVVAALVVATAVVLPSIHFCVTDSSFRSAEMAENPPAMLQAARRLQPSLPSFYYPIGEQLAFNAKVLHDTESGAMIDHVFAEAAAINPRQPETFFRWGLMLQIADMNDKALPRFDDALALYPNWPNALRGKSVSLLELGRNQQAIDILQHLLDRHPHDAAAQELLRRALDAVRTR